MRAYFLLFVVSCAAIAQTVHVVKYHATINDVKYVFGPAAPVAHVKPGDTIETNTLDAFGDVLKKPGDTQKLVKGDNPLTGPLYVDGAQPGDTLAVKILDLQVDGNQGVGALSPGNGALSANPIRLCCIHHCRRRSGSIRSTRRATPRRSSGRA
jgi:acetamidase/formamidase